MSSYETVIRGGTVVTAADMVRADVGIAGGQVVALGANLDKGAKEIDAAGLLVLPGGIDSHCHIEQPGSSGGTNADSFVSGTTAAACGGTTTVICFSPQTRGGSVKAAQAHYQSLAARSVIDYCYHLIVNDPTDKVIDEELPELIRQGHRSIKIFMTYDSNFLTDAQVLKVMACCRRNQALLVVHAENHEAIKFLTQSLMDAGLTSPKYHAWSKPIAVEREAIHRVATFSELLDQPVQIFHVSGGEAADELQRHQARGVKIFGETCPQYLVLTQDDMNRDGFEGAKFVCSPAPRAKADQAAIWRHLANGTLGVVTSDHAPYKYNDVKGKQLHGSNAPFTQIPNGIPGIETRLPILFSEGVSQGRIDLSKFVALSSTNPAKLFGLYPRKGTIAIGADGDIAIWDPKQKVTLANDKLHHGCDYTPYEGLEVVGYPAMTLSRGEVLWDRGKVTVTPGRGQFLARGPYDYIKPQNRFVTPFNPVEGKLLER